MVDYLARPVGDTEPLLDEDLRDPVDDDDGGRDDRQQEVAAGPGQRGDTLSTLTCNSSPSAFRASEQEPSGADPRATSTASVSAAM